MKKLLVALVIAGTLVSAEAMAQGRVGSAAIGAVSGAIVLGPVGAVAGAVIGFTAGPSIVNAWGVNRYAPPPRARRESQASFASQAPAARDTGGQQQQAAVKPSPPAPSAPPSQPKSSEALPAKQAAPPVQGFD